jgi:hypothetical protein
VHAAFLQRGGVDANERTSFFSLIILPSHRFSQHDGAKSGYYNNNIKKTTTTTTTTTIKKTDGQREKSS